MRRWMCRADRNLYRGPNAFGFCDGRCLAVSHIARTAVRSHPSKKRLKSSSEVESVGGLGHLQGCPGAEFAVSQVT